MTVSRIRFLIPYFGRWPFWMPFFLESCRHNPDIDWLMFSDCGVPEELPPNVMIQEMSFEDYCALVSERLEIDFRPGSAYKLCDIKPALGYIHAEHLAGFDLWAFGDIDLVYGNLRAYFHEERLRAYDLLSTHERRISGHLCMLRNSERMREAFMAVPNWQSKFAAVEHVAFDEKDFSRLFVRHKNWPKWLRSAADFANHWRRRSEFKEAFSTPFGRIPWVHGRFEFPESWIWERGNLRNDKDGERQFPYFHFLFWKHEAWGNLPNDGLVFSEKLFLGRGWKISTKGFSAWSKREQRAP